jgi:hypothetical protein
MKQQQIEEECKNHSLDRNAATTNRIGMQQKTAGIGMQQQQIEEECNNNSLDKNATTTNKIGMQQQELG